MSFLRPLLYGLAGAAAATALLFACGDDAQSDAAEIDAATPACDCPSAERPLAGRIVTISIDTDFENAGAAQSVTCDARAPNKDATLLGGTCEITTQTGNAYLKSAGGCSSWSSIPEADRPRTYCCVASGEAPNSGTLIATAICLLPPDAP